MYCDVTQSLKLRKSSKQPRNEDSKNMKPLSISESPACWDNLMDIWELRNLTLPVSKLRNTHHSFTEVLAFLRQSFSGSTWLSLLHSASTAYPSLVAIYLLRYVTSFAWSNLIGAPRTWRLEQKLNRQLTRLFFPSACEKLSGHETSPVVLWNTITHHATPSRSPHNELHSPS